MENITPQRKVWFKRKLYGWGWTPASWQGWVVTILYLVLVFSFLSFQEEAISGNPESGSNFLILGLPVVIATAVLIYIAYKKGEKPRWQWGRRIED